jgi:hypothetical protein
MNDRTQGTETWIDAIATPFDRAWRASVRHGRVGSRKPGREPETGTRLVLSSKTASSKAVRIKGTSFDGQARVTLKLAKPYKGAVKMTGLAGIAAADGASSASDFSAVLD